MHRHRKYPMRFPRFAAGIRAQEGRGGPGGSWWARRWQAVLEGMGLKSRLGRGKNYALSGQVTKLAIAGPEVTAEVVGTREEPYRVGIRFRTPEAAARKRIVAALRAEPMLVARLLADELPLEVEGVFKANGCDFFPGGKLAPGVYDMTTDCSCPDYMNPCKHVTAVLLLLGEELARRPATLLELRGIAMEELCGED